MERITDLYPAGSFGSRSNIHRKGSRKLNPFMIDVVLRVVFKCVDYPTLQSCRLVCTKWCSLSNPTFIKRSMIVFRNNEHAYRHPFNLRELFVTFHPFPINSFQFENDIWPIETLETFCNETKNRNQRKKYVHDLRILNIRLLDENWNMKQSYDVSYLINPQLKKLVLRCNDEREFTKFSVSLNSLVQVDYLHLQRCNIFIPLNAIRVNPKKIYFSQLLFFQDYQNGLQELKCLKLNNIVDFRRAEDMEIVNADGRKLMIDFGCEKFKIERLYLDGILCLNSAKSVWAIKRLTLRNIQFDVKGQIAANITELNIEHTTFDFTVLPRSVEKLTLYNVAVTRNAVPNLKTIVPRLKRLSLKLMYGDMFKVILNMFTVCETLVDVELCSPVLNLDINLIPKNVRTLKLSSGVNIYGEGVRYLKRLIVECHDFGNIASLKVTLSKLWSEYLSFVSYTSHAREFVQMFPDRDFVIGECIWEDDSDGTIFKRFLEYVDEKASYYYFRRGQGIAITKDEFNKYTNLIFNY